LFWQCSITPQRHSNSSDIAVDLVTMVAPPMIIHSQSEQAVVVLTELPHYDGRFEKIVSFS